MEFNTATSTPNVKLLEFLSNTEYKLILGKTKFIKNTNLKFNEPSIYKIIKLNIDILEYYINKNEQ